MVENLARLRLRASSGIGVAWAASGKQRLKRTVVGPIVNPALSLSKRCATPRTGAEPHRVQPFELGPDPALLFFDAIAQRIGGQGGVTIKRTRQLEILHQLATNLNAVSKAAT